MGGYDEGTTRENEGRDLIHKKAKGLGRPAGENGNQDGATGPCF